MTDPFLAHAGGIDEIAMIAAPLLIFFWLRRASKRRRLQENQNGEQKHSPHP